jgi:hypothetical protein
MWVLLLGACLSKPPFDDGSDGDDAGDDGDDGVSFPTACGPVTNLPNTIQFSGAYLDSEIVAAIAGVSVSGTANGTAAGSDITDLQGAYSFALPAAAMPLDATFAFARRGEYLPHAAYFQRPFADTPIELEVRAHSETTIAALYANHGLQRTPGFATIIVVLDACSGGRVAGATASVALAEQVVYPGGGAATDASGVAYALDVLPGPVGLSAGGSAGFGLTARADEVVYAYLVQP